MSSFKDYFSTQASDYARYRPTYPQELFEYITSFVKTKELAWDCATGNGQAARELCKYFDQVIATDGSSNQIESAIKHEKIIYKIESAESTSLLSSSVDLITVAQALHWFDFDKFYAEVRRVGKKNSIIAVWCYNEPSHSDFEINKLLNKFYVDLDPYWHKERKYIDEEFKTIPFPFEEIKSKSFSIEKNGDLNELMGYLCTWSAVQNFIKTNEYNPLEALYNNFLEKWKSLEGAQWLRWKLHLRLGKVHG